MTDMNAANEHFEKAAQGVMKACEDMSGMAREQMDAAVKSATAFSTGLEEITRNTSGLLQESFQRGIAAGKTIMGARNLREAADLHTEFMKDCFDTWVAGTGKISEISARMTQNALAPMAEHATNAMTKIKQTVQAVQNNAKAA